MWDQWSWWLQQEQFQAQDSGSWKLNECHMNIAHGKLLLISDALSDKTGHYYEHQWNANDYYNINNHTSAHKLVD